MADILFCGNLKSNRCIKRKDLNNDYRSKLKENKYNKEKTNLTLLILKMGKKALYYKSTVVSGLKLLTSLTLEIKM